MTHNEIEHMWKIARNDPHHDTNWHDPVVVKFANMVAEAEREACAKVCEEYTDKSDSDHESHGYTCAIAIRARGDKND
jgi:hypothetical protein